MYDSRLLLDVALQRPRVVDVGPGVASEKPSPRQPSRGPWRWTWPRAAHEGVAVAVAVLLLRRRRVGAPPLGAAVEHRGFGPCPASDVGAQHARCARLRARGPTSQHWRAASVGGGSWLATRSLTRPAGPAAGPMTPRTTPPKPDEAQNPRLGAEATPCLFGARKRPWNPSLLPQRSSPWASSHHWLTSLSILLLAKQPRKSRHRASTPKLEEAASRTA